MDLGGLCYRSAGIFCHGHKGRGSVHRLEKSYCPAVCKFPQRKPYIFTVYVTAPNKIPKKPSSAHEEEPPASQGMVSFLFFVTL